MMTAAVAAARGKKVVLTEKNNMLGKKLLITGKGRCNITNNADIEEFFKNVPRNSNFLYSAFYSFTNADLIRLLNKLGLETKVERGGRIFPVSDKSKDVLNALKKLLAKNGVVLYNSEVADILSEDGKKRVIFADKKSLLCDKVVIATGGVSYPSTGSTGDGYKFAQKFGHTVIPPKPSLVPLETKENVYPMMGLSLKNVVLSVYDGKKADFFRNGRNAFHALRNFGPARFEREQSHKTRPGVRV